MSATSVTMCGRAAAERNMIDTCTVTREGLVTTDDLTGAVTSTPTTVYAGKCKVQQLTAVGRRYDAGEVSVIIRKFDVHLPVVGSEQVERGDLVTIGTGQLDGALTDKVYRVREVFAKTFATARRLGVEEVT